MTDAPSPDRLRVLILAPFSPRLDAPHGGGRVLADFLSVLSTRHQVAVLFLRAPDEPAADEFFVERCDRVEEVIRTWAGPSFLTRIWRMGRLLSSLLLWGKPLWVTDCESREFAVKIQKFINEWHPDIIQFELHIMGQYATLLKDSPVPRVLVEYEPGILAAPYLKAGPAVFRRWIHQLDQAAWKSFEPAILRQVQTIVVFTEKDHRTLSSLNLPVPIVTIPFGTKLPKRPLSPLGHEPKSLVFVGNFLHPPNIEAALVLTRDIYPPLRQEFPELALYIVGPNPPVKLKQYADERVTITGWVPEVTPYLDRAAVFVAPLLSGSGMRVKILEAMSAGKAIVTSPLAVEGLEVQDGREIFLGKDVHEMIKKVHQLLAEPDTRAALAGRARIWACGNLGWEQPVATFENLYRSLLKRPE